MSAPSIIDSEPGSSYQMSEYEPPGAKAMSEQKLSHQGGVSDRSSYTHQQSVGSRPSPEDEDPLLRTIKAQHSLTRQTTDELSDTSALLSTRDLRDGTLSSPYDISASETEF